MTDQTKTSQTPRWVHLLSFAGSIVCAMTMAFLCATSWIGIPINATWVAFLGACAWFYIAILDAKDICK